MTLDSARPAKYSIYPIVFLYDHSKLIFINMRIYIDGEEQRCQRVYSQADVRTNAGRKVETWIAVDYDARKKFPYHWDPRTVTDKHLRKKNKGIWQ